MKYRAVWIDNDGRTIYGLFTRNISTARDESRLKVAIGFVSWVEDEEHNRV